MQRSSTPMNLWKSVLCYKPITNLPSKQEKEKEKEKTLFTKALKNRKKKEAVNRPTQEDERKSTVKM